MYRFIEETFTPGGGERGYIKAAKGVMDALVLGHVTGVSLSAGGSSYVVGDILTLAAAGASALFNCRIEVLTVDGGGAVTGFAMRSSGAFDTLPDVTAGAEATTGGSGSGATFVVTDVEAPYIAEVDSGGSSYSVGDVVTISGGTLHGGESASSFVVTAESGGVVTAVEPLHVGRYDVLPSNPASTTTGGGGSSLTVNLEPFMWAHPDATSENYVDDDTDFSFWLRGVNSAGGHPVCGIKTMRTGAFRFWGLKCATSFNPAATFENQPNASQGDYTLPATDSGCRIATTDSAVTIFLAWTARNINFVSRTAPTYEHGYLGLFLPFIDSPATKYPFPLLCAGTTRADDVGINTAFNGRGVNNESTMHCSILHHGEGQTGTTAGPHLLRDLIGAWGSFEIPQASDLPAFAIWPLASDPSFSGAPIDAPNIETGSGTLTPQGIGNTALQDNESGVSSNGPFNSNTILNPTPFGVGGEELYFMVAPLIYQRAAGIVQLYGELTGVYAINGRGLSAEDRITDAAGARYFVFTDALSNENRNFIAIREGD